MQATRRTVYLVLLAASLSACATIGRDRADRVDLAAQAFPARDVAACYWAAHRVTSPDATMAAPPWSGTPWTQARESLNLTASSKAPIERDIRRGVYDSCLDARN